VNGFRHHHQASLATLHAMAEEHGLDESGRAVVKGRVGHVETGEATDQGLELEDDLEGALRNLD
jgi:hypothetical protein